jgi:hypothetical protein
MSRVTDKVTAGFMGLHHRKKVAEKCALKARFLEAVA